MSAGYSFSLFSFQFSNETNLLCFAYFRTYWKGRGGLMVGALSYGSDQAVLVRALDGDSSLVFLGKTLYSCSASLYPGV